MGDITTGTTTATTDTTMDTMDTITDTMVTIMVRGQQSPLHHMDTITVTTVIITVTMDTTTDMDITTEPKLTGGIESFTMLPPLVTASFLPQHTFLSQLTSHALTNTHITVS